MKESAPVVKSVETEGVLESTKLQESIDRARGLRDQLEVFNGTNVVGTEDLNEVERIANALSVELSTISGSICVAEGLPYHPMDSKL